MWRETLRTSQGEMLASGAPLWMSEHIQHRGDRWGTSIATREDNVGVTGGRGLGSCHEYVPHGWLQIETLKEYTICKVNEKRSNEHSMKLDSSECNQLVNQHADDNTIS